LRPQHPADEDAGGEDRNDTESKLHVATPAPAARPAARRNPRRDHGIAGLLVVDAEARENIPSRAVVVPQETQEDVLRAYGTLTKGARLVNGTLDGPLAPSRERDELSPDLLLAAAGDPLDGRPRLFEAQSLRTQNPCSEPPLAAEDAEQKVLGSDLLVPEAVRLVPSEIKGLSGFPTEPLHSTGGYWAAEG
jgi:hypothetical protein